MKNKLTLTFLLFISLFITTSKLNAQAVNVQDSLALVDLYNSTNGASWINHENWLTSPVSSWFGITTVAGRVTTINLGYNHLNGNIPFSIGNITNLNGLFLYGNELKGNIPTSIGSLTKLTFLGLDYNELTGNIPNELSNLTNLQGFGLAFNQFTGEIPSWLGNLNKLTTITISSNQLTGSIPAQLGNLIDLDGLFLYDNYLSGMLPNELGKLQKLRFLGIHHNQLSGSLPVDLTKMKNLQYFTLNDNQFTGAIPHEIGNMSALINLFCQNNYFSGNIPLEIGKLKHITYMDLSNNDLIGNIPVELENIDNPTLLNFSNNSLSGEIPDAIANIVVVDHLNIASNFFTYAGMEKMVQNHSNNPFSLIYSPQGKINLYQTTDHFFVSAGGTYSNNTYKWYMEGQPNTIIVTSDSAFYPTKSGRYYAVVSNSVCKDLTLTSYTETYFGVLPVTIVNPKAYQKNDIIKVDWTSLTELNIEKYEVQRSNNITDFKAIGGALATGNGTASTTYSFDDVKPQKGTNYYRIKIYDKDGKITYSKTLSVNFTGESITLIYPNPAKNILYIKTSNTTSFDLINQSGKILISKFINNSGSMNVSGVVAGLYYLRNINTGIVQKVIISK